MAKAAEHSIKKVGAPSKPTGTAGRTTQAATQARQAVSARKSAAARRSMTRTRQAAKAAQTTAKKHSGGRVVFVIILVINGLALRPVLLQ